MPKIAIGYVSGGAVEQRFMYSVQQFIEADAVDRHVYEGIGNTGGLYVDDNRNELVREFRKHSLADYMLMVDSDIQFDFTHVYQLLDDAEAHDRQIESALYFSFLADGRMRPVWFDEVSPGGSVTTYGGNDPIELVVPLAACGMGFCLIRRDVFDKMAEVPEWAADDWTWFGRDKYLLPNGLPKHHGEDICFCVRAGSIGIQPWGHKGVPVIHFKKTPLTIQLFQAVNEWEQRHNRSWQE